MFYSSTLYCICGERLSLHSEGGCFAGINVLLTLSAHYSVLAEGGDVGAEWLFLSLSRYLAPETRASSGGRDAGAKERHAKDWQHPCRTQCHCDVYQCVQLWFCFCVLVLVWTLKGNIFQQIKLPSVVFIYTPSGEKLWYNICTWYSIFHILNLISCFNSSVRNKTTVFAEE